MMISILAVFIAVAVLWITTVFNQIRELEDETRDAWDRLAMHLRQRHDATAELLREVADVVDFEDLLETADHINTSARQMLDRSGLDHGVRATARLQATLSDVLSQLKVTLGHYPDWHPRRRIQELLEEVAGAETLSGDALRAYNQTAHTMISRTEQPGWNAVARLAGPPVVEVWTDVSHTSSGPAPAILEYETKND